MVLEDIQSFAPLGTKLFFHENSSRKNSVVLTPNMAPCHVVANQELGCCGNHC